MILVHIYIAEHKNLREINIPISGAFCCAYKDGELRVQKGEDSSDYYHNHHCSALIGPNGVGKSSILEVLELITAKNDSIAAVIFFDFKANAYYACTINMPLEQFSKIDADCTFNFVSDNSIFIEENNIHLVKINALSSDDGALSFQKQQKFKHVHNLNFRQNLKSATGKKRYFEKLLSYYNDSFDRDQYMEEIAFEFVFSASPKSIVQRAIGSSKVGSDLLPAMLSKWDEANQEFELSEEVVGHGAVFQSLLKLNTLSILSTLASESKLENLILPQLIFDFYTIDLEASQHMSVSNRLRLMLNKFDPGLEFGDERLDDSTAQTQALGRKALNLEALKNELEKILEHFDNISLILTDHCFDYDRECLDLRSARTTDYYVVENLTRAINALPSNIASNMRWGWRGISSGELARTHIFSESYHHLKSTDSQANNLLLIDEADLYLHPEWQRTFLHDFLLHLSHIEESRNIKRVQLVICTHSPIIISDFLPADIISLIKNEDNETEVSKSIGFGNSITDIYMSGMHLKSTFGEHGRIKISRLLRSAQQGQLSESDRTLIEKISSISIRNLLLNYDQNK